MWSWNLLLLLVGLLYQVHGDAEHDKSNEMCRLETEILPLSNRPRTLSVIVHVDFKKEMQAELQKVQNKIIDKFEQALIQTSVIALNNSHTENRINLLLTQNENTIKLIRDPENMLQITGGKIRFDESLNLIRDEQIPENCNEAMMNETSQDGIYVLKVPNNKLEAFGAYCKRFEDSGWTIIQRRQDGYVQFFTNWTDYKNGFGDLNAEYWLGLERLHLMTTARNYELWIQLESYAGEKRFARYSTFSVASEAEKYKATVTGYSGNAGNSFGETNDKPFVTADNDKDNCAQKCKSGWWHYCDFSYSNLNGEYKSFSGRKVSDHTAIYWKDWLGYDESLKYTHMAIRPT